MEKNLPQMRGLKKESIFTYFNVQTLIMKKQTSERKRQRGINFFTEPQKGSHWNELHASSSLEEESRQREVPRES